ncbi:MAG: GNAT family N-acetyltransferase [Dehalococcoidia bacterium]|nr:GNAT family N-acetyltransferase [Dehalococcoidia bacterium]
MHLEQGNVRARSASSIESLTIRPLLASEIPALAASIEEMSAAQFENRWREQENGYRELLVAELDGELVGTVSIRHSIAQQALHLFALEVGLSWRRRGVGSAIVAHVLEEARRRRLRSVYLEVRVDNPARKLYHRLGFRRVGKPFLNAWWRFGDDGSQRRVEELSFRMVRRVSR